MPKNTLTLNALEISVFLGWGEAERAVKQKVVLDISFVFAAELQACTSDELADTFCYDTLITAIHQFIADKSYRLVEKLSYDIFQFIKQQIPFTTLVSVCLTKKPAINSLTGGISFCCGDF